MELPRQTMLMRQWAALVPYSGPTAITPTTRQQMVAAIHLAESVAPWASTSGKLVLACFDPQWSNLNFAVAYLKVKIIPRLLRWYGPRITGRTGDWSIGANAMRSVLALGLLIALCASANAARVHHSKPRHVIVRPSQSVDPRFPPVLQDQTPSYNDPSKFGGG